ncbi:MAG TPA: MOSC domain-containing protein [Nannocystis sp.]
MVAQINVNPAGGVPKLPVAAAFVGPEGVEGDLQRDRVHHGGPDRAVSLFSLERIAALAAEGHPITPGSTGENLTVAGLDWSALAASDRLAVGDEVLLEITGPATPCNTIAASFTNGAFTRISHKLHPGWSRLYARVLRPGLVRRQAPICLLEHEH